MKTIFQTTLAVSLAVAFAAPVSANELDGNDPVVASFERSMHYRPNPTGEFLMSNTEQDCLPGLVRAALEDVSSSQRETFLAHQD